MRIHSKLLSTTLPTVHFSPESDSLQDQDQSYAATAQNVLSAFPASRIIASSSFNDDLQWWALAYVRLFEVLGNSSALVQASIIFDYVYANAWDAECGGEHL